MNKGSWLDDARGTHVLHIANLCGIETRRRNERKAEVVCPACGDRTRHHKSGDTRLSADVVHHGKGWFCFQCNAKGDAIDFAAYVFGGQRFAEANQSTRDRVRELFDGRVRLPKVLTEQQPSAPRHVPAEELQAVWAGCCSVTEDVEVSEYLRGRGIDPAAVAADDLARALTTSGPTSRWMKHRPCADAPATNWRQSGHRLVVPLHDTEGAMRSLLARLVRSPRAGERKSSAPMGCDRGGLAMACRATIEMLRTGRSPNTDGRAFRIYATEGEIDFLSACVRIPESSDVRVRAVIGIVNGTLTSELGKRFPSGAQVVSLFDKDDEGTKYEMRLRGILPHGCSFGSWRT